MRLKHNKKRNTAFVYEALIRELTKSIVKNNKNKQIRIVSIMKEHFAKGTELNKELDLYKSVYETRDIEKRIAEKIVVEAKEKYSDLNKKNIFREQSALINKINKTLSKNLFNNFVPNYKNIATVYSIFQDALPVKDRVLLEENIIEQMSQSCEAPSKEGQQPIDNIVYNTFVSKFNNEYSSALNENQKNLLGKYISSFSDNGVELKLYLNEEVGKLKKGLLQYKNSEEDIKENTKEQIDNVYSILDSYKKKEIDSDLVEIVLKTQELLEEINKNDSNS